MKGTMIAGLLVLAADLLAAPFKDGDTVVFLGDSITHGGRYHNFITDFYRTRYPEARIRFVNSGIGGDTTGGAMRRLSEDVAEYRPTHVAVHFGMNDIDRLAHSRETSADLLVRRATAQARYRANLDTLVGAVKAVAPRAELIYLTTTVYDETAVVTNIPPGASGWATVNQVGCAVGLAEMAGHVLAKAKADGVLGVDWYSPLNNYLLSRQKEDPHFMLTRWDRVHPDDLGHSIMAWAFLEAQGVDPVVSEVEVDVTQGSVLRCANASLTNLACTDRSLSFVLLEKALPFPVVPTAREAAAAFHVAEKLNREILAVKGLSAGAYELLIDGESVGSYAAEELSAGVNLAFNAATPQFAQAQAVAQRDAELRQVEFVLRNHHSARWYYYNRTNVDDLEGLVRWVEEHPPKDAHFSRFVPGYVAYWQTYRETRAALLADQEAVYALAKPRPHRYELRTAEDRDGN